jgi:peptidoglycan/LPS O-acetylase OafA/YrhL
LRTHHPINVEGLSMAHVAEGVARGVPLSERLDSSPPPSLPQARGRSPALDGVRAIAVILVVAHNAGLVQVRAASHLLKGAFFLHNLGWVGVQLFFALSGFLITGSLLDGRGPNAIQSFWIRRALRICPLYFAMLVPVSLMVIACHRSLHPLGNPADLWWYWTWLANWGQPIGHRVPLLSQFWSLAIEEQFYLTWPLLVLRFPPRTVLGSSLALALVALIIRIQLCSLGLPAVAYENTLARMDALVLGAACAVLIRDASGLAVARKFSGPIAIGSGLVLLAMVRVTRGFNVADPIMQSAGYGILSVFFAALVLWAFLNEGTARARWLRTPWLRWIGIRSYGIYVFHFPIAVLMAPWLSAAINDGPPAKALVALITQEMLVAALAAAAAAVSWRLVELPVLAWRERLSLAARVGPLGDQALRQH